MFGGHSDEITIPTLASDENIFVNYNLIFTPLDGMHNPHFRPLKKKDKVVSHHGEHHDNRRFVSNHDLCCQ